MEITWLGHSCFRIKCKEATILTDPLDSSTGYSLGKPSANIVTVSHGHPGHSNVNAVHGEPRVLTGPGEYEVKGVVITGVATHHDAEGGKERGKNTVFLYEAEDILVCHLGDLGYVPAAADVESFGNIDILMVPVGGNTTIGAAQAVEVISLLEPKIVIPMHYRTDASKHELDPLERFCREMAVPHPEPQPKLTVTQSGLPDTTKVVVLEYRKG